MGTEPTVGLLLESRTTAPALGAAADKFTVPCEVEPPATLAGLKVSELAITPPGVWELGP